MVSMEREARRQRSVRQDVGDACALLVLTIEIVQFPPFFAASLICQSLLK